MAAAELDTWYMIRALELAERGRGHVEPNPMVGCLVVQESQIVGEGWHRRFGGPHAEVEALRLAGPRAQGATMYVTLEPCAHHGKTPPCIQAIVGAGVRRVVAAMQDPFPAVAGQGLAALRQAGVEVEVGLLEVEARRLAAPYLKLVQQGLPWVITKWAMTLDGKIATRTGDSRWISGPAARTIVHQLRGRVDGVLVGSRTVVRDDPLLTARPAGPRTASRIVVDTHAGLPAESQLVRTADQVPVIVACGPQATPAAQQRLRDAGVEVLVCPGTDYRQRMLALLAELGRRRMTNLLVEGGGTVLGTLADLRQVDEAHVFIAPKILGGQDAPPPVAGQGVEALAAALRLDSPSVQQVGEDLYVSGYVQQIEEVNTAP